MVNCITCKRSFRSSIGKNKNTRCESCAISWREQELIQKQIEKDKTEKENEIRFQEILLKEKQLELEKQKITIKETLSNGAAIELTCYYDQTSHHKINELLSGARKSLPAPPKQRPTLLPSETRCVNNRRKSIFEKPKPLDDSLEYRLPRKLPSIDSLAKNRVTQRYKLDEDAGSSAGSGMSVD